LLVGFQKLEKIAKRLESPHRNLTTPDLTRERCEIAEKVSAAHLATLALCSEVDDRTRPAKYAFNWFAISWL